VYLQRHTLVRNSASQIRIAKNWFCVSVKQCRYKKHQIFEMTLKNTWKLKLKEFDIACKRKCKHSKCVKAETTIFFGRFLAIKSDPVLCFRRKARLKWEISLKYRTKMGMSKKFLIRWFSTMVKESIVSNFYTFGEISGHLPVKRTLLKLRCRGFDSKLTTRSTVYRPHWWFSSRCQTHAPTADR